MDAGTTVCIDFFVFAALHVAQNKQINKKMKKFFIVYLLNISMQIYDNTFAEGYLVHLCIFHPNVGYIIIHDIHTGIGEMQYFTDLNRAIEFVRRFIKT